MVLYRAAILKYSVKFAGKHVQFAEKHAGWSQSFYLFIYITINVLHVFLENLYTGYHWE